MVLHHTFENASNAQLAHVCGELDAHLKTITAAFGIKLTRRHDAFRIEGPAAAARQALGVLQMLCLRADAPISDEHLQLLLIEAGAAAPEPEAPAGISLHTRRKDLAARTPNQHRYLERILAHDLSFGIGPAGTGKTYLAVACAVDALERNQVQRIVLTRPAVEAGERLGFLPGDLAQKVDPYLRPLFDALFDLMGIEKVNKAQEKGLLEVAPLAFMRGRTLNHAFVILDEAQNTTPEQMKMFLTRIGYGSRAVVTGDTSQIDLPRGATSGLVDAQQVLHGVEGIAFTQFTRADVVRHPLVGRIVEAYDKRALQPPGPDMSMPTLSLSLQFSDPRHRAQLPRHKVARWIRHALSAEAEITVRIVGEDEGRELNRGFRAKDYATNVLTFDYDSDPVVVADLVLCAPVVEREAAAEGKSLEAHYAHLVVHGALHAQGWDHETAREAKKMEAYETEILAGLGYPNPYEPR